MSERIRRQETLLNHKEFVSTMTLDPPSTAFSVRRMSALPCRICSWEILQQNQIVSFPRSVIGNLLAFLMPYV